MLDAYLTDACSEVFELTRLLLAHLLDMYLLGCTNSPRACALLGVALFERACTTFFAYLATNDVAFTHQQHEI